MTAKRIYLFFALCAVSLLAACGQQAVAPDRGPADQVMATRNPHNSAVSPNLEGASTQALPASIRIAGVGANAGYRASQAAVANGDVTGTYTAISAGTFNSMTVEQLRGTYDVLVITWATDPALNADWTTRLVPYMELGGGIIWEDFRNVGDLEPGVTAQQYESSAFGATLAVVSGLTDGVGSNFVNSHTRFTAWHASLTPFISTSSDVLGLWGGFGSGCIVLTGPDNDYHGRKASASLAERNQYALLVNEIHFVASGCGLTNVAPTAVANATDPHTPYEVDEGSSISLSGSGTDPDSSIVAYEWDLDYDGVTFNVDSTDQNPTFDAATLDGPTTVTVALRVKDDDGAYSDVSTADLTVHNVPPSIDSITPSTVDPVEVNTLVAISAAYTDPGVADTHIASIDWGDGTTGAGTATAGTASGDHTYTTAGVYTVGVTVTDDDGGSGSASYQYIVVYDPSAGFVTGGGWIDSPAGAYPADPGLSGKANFGFVSRYQRGKTTPQGQTQFQFHAAGFNFHSTSYQWLVISGPKAQYKGTGTVNGAGEYGFILTANDGQANGGGGVDRFRLKVWETVDGVDVIVYDNQTGESLDADATDAIEGGSIVIHNKK